MSRVGQGDPTEPKPMETPNHLLLIVVVVVIDKFKERRTDSSKAVQREPDSFSTNMNPFHGMHVRSIACSLHI